MATKVKFPICSHYFLLPGKLCMGPMVKCPQKINFQFAPGCLSHNAGEARTQEDILNLILIFTIMKKKKTKNYF